MSTNTGSNEEQKTSQMSGMWSKRKGKMVQGQRGKLESGHV